MASCTTDSTSVAGDLYLQSVAMCTMDSAAVYTLWIFGRLYLQSVAEDVQSSKYSHIDHGMMLYSYVAIQVCKVSRHNSRAATLPACILHTVYWIKGGYVS